MAPKIIIPTSGGKDSQACLKLAIAQHGPANVRGFFCDTRFEHPWTYAHVERLRTMYGPIEIDTACGGSVLEKSVKYGRFPGGGARHCTDELKIRLTVKYLKWLALLEGGDFEVWYGMRSAESAEREARYRGKIDSAIYQPHEVMPSKYPQYLGAMGIRFRLPVVDWSESEVLGLLGDEANPLYAAGFPRVGCFPCLASGDLFKEKAFDFDDFGREQRRRVIQISQAIGKSVWSSKGGRARNEAPCGVCSE